jgi:hypothetical protein
MVGTGTTTLALPSKPWHVLRSMPQRLNTSQIQLRVRTLRRTPCLCLTLEQITSEILPYLVDDRDGTTDFTRTIHYGLPTDLEREIYTRLLKGILAIEATSFPEGTTGYQIDSIIRQHLWAGGFDYPGVATGHGVSHGLGVIEGGASISSLKPADQMGMREGMIMTIGINEMRF